MPARRATVPRSPARRWSTHRLGLPPDHAPQERTRAEWKRVDAEPGDLGDVLDAAERVATVDGDVNSREKAVLAELRERCRRG